VGTGGMGKMPAFLFNLQGDEVPFIDPDGIDLPL
jgi:hypothetical protein